MSGLRKALEELHKPLRVYTIDQETGEYQLNAEGNKVLTATLCRGCTSEETVDAVSWKEFDEDCDYISYPCETAAILAAHPDDSVTEWGVRWAGEEDVMEYQPSDKATVMSCMRSETAWAKRDAVRSPLKGELVSRQVTPWQVTK